MLAPARETRAPQLLDVGCGTGVVTAAALALGAEVTAVDPDPGMLELVARRHPHATVRAAALPDLPFEDEQFDAIVGNFVINHVPDTPKALAELHRVLCPGGTIALTWWKSGEMTATSVFADAIAATGIPYDPPPRPFTAHDTPPPRCTALHRAAAGGGLPGSGRRHRAGVSRLRPPGPSHPQTSAGREFLETHARQRREDLPERADTGLISVATATGIFGTGRVRSVVNLLTKRPERGPVSSPCTAASPDVRGGEYIGPTPKRLTPPRRPGRRARPAAQRVAGGSRDKHVGRLGAGVGVRPAVTALRAQVIEVGPALGVRVTGDGHHAGGGGRAQEQAAAARWSVPNCVTNPSLASHPGIMPMPALPPGRSSAGRGIEAGVRLLAMPGCTQPSPHATSPARDACRRTYRSRGQRPNRRRTRRFRGQRSSRRRACRSSRRATSSRCWLSASLLRALASLRSSDATFSARSSCSFVAASSASRHSRCAASASWSSLAFLASASSRFLARAASSSGDGFLRPAGRSRGTGAGAKPL
ncbi:class I SAM-dependent methyltransferase [Nonomuraea diastatica]|uniref:Class I SAM-dependent methyltransferase n=1 Tax=Nonomuraea diastatica TaxID=1848329 RepID=A0A4R4WIH0_9ACTN|nr:class I SAM-dependent methyltransferase [Nonomuraea diastatica]